MHVLRYGQAPTDAGATNVWAIDAEDGRILAAIRVTEASPVVFVAIAVAPVRTRSHARGQFAIARVDESTWTVERGEYDAHLSGLLPVLSLLLLGAPQSVSEQIERLP